MTDDTKCGALVEFPPAWNRQPAPCVLPATHHTMLGDSCGHAVRFGNHILRAPVRPSLVEMPGGCRYRNGSCSCQIGKWAAR